MLCFLTESNQQVYRDSYPLKSWIISIHIAIETLIVEGFLSLIR